jgi:hypothetical protein
MRRIVPVLVAASLAVSGAALAQNAASGSNTGLTTGAAPGTSSGAVTPGMGPSGTAPPAATTTAAPGRTTAAPAPGANSFTMGQARARIQRHGFAQVSGLHKDNQGVWRAKAVKDGQPVNVSLDYQGNVIAQ